MEELLHMLDKQIMSMSNIDISNELSLVFCSLVFHTWGLELRSKIFFDSAKIRERNPKSRIVILYPKMNYSLNS
jgi:hypothetical protein